MKFTSLYLFILFAPLALSLHLVQEAQQITTSSLILAPPEDNGCLIDLNIFISKKGFTFTASFSSEFDHDCDSLAFHCLPRQNESSCLSDYAPGENPLESYDWVAFNRQIQKLMNPDFGNNNVYLSADPEVPFSVVFRASQLIEHPRIGDIGSQEELWAADAMPEGLLVNYGLEVREDFGKPKTFVNYYSN